MAGRRRSILALCLLVSCVGLPVIATGSETVSYTYDAGGRLVKVARSGTVNNGVSACYAYDKADNRTLGTVATADCVPGAFFLYAGQSMSSADGRFMLIMQTDGNLVLYGPDGYMWATATNGGSDRRMVMQADGNLVVYNSVDQALWNSGTYGNPGARLTLQNDGNLVIYSSTNAVLWHTNTPYVPPSFSINDVSANEGGGLSFTVTRSKATTATYTVNYATADGTATGGDYYGGPGSITFAPSESTKPITIGTIDDASVEGAETMIVNLTGATGGGTIGDGQGTGTINDNDTPPPPACNGVNFTITSNGAVTEGVGSGFTVTKNGTATGSCNVNYATANGSAVASSDYSAASGTLTFTTGQTSQPISVTTTDDAAVESVETFSVSLSSPTAGAVIGSPGSATATINDNDAPPSVAISDAYSIESGSLIFTVTRTGSTAAFSVQYATANGSATSTSDYVAASGTLSFAVGENSKTITIQTRNNSTIEATENFSVNLSNPIGATISDGQGVGTIDDDDEGGGCPPGGCP